MAHNNNRGRSISTKGIPRPHTGGPRPHVWISGPDPVRHKKYRVWIQQKNQAQFRQEGWSIPFEEWLEIWGDDWEHRGREKGTLCMTRSDWSLPWTRDNVRIVPREEHARMQGEAVRNGWRSVAQKHRRTRLGLDQ